MYKTPHVRTNFGSSDLENGTWHAAVARSAFASQNVPNTSCAEQFLKVRSAKMARRCGRSTFTSQNAQNATWSGHFLNFRCPKMARRCGAKRIFKWKCTKHRMFGPILEVPIWKMAHGTPLWREAHLQVKMYQTPHARSNFWRSDLLKWRAAVAEAHLQVKMHKTLHGRATFWTSDVLKWHAAVGQSAFSSENVQNTACSDHFLKLRCRKISQLVSQSISQLVNKSGSQLVS